VVGLVCGVFDRGDDVFPLKRRVIRKDFLEGSARRQKLKHVGHTNAQATNARPPAAFPFFYRNPLQPLAGSALTGLGKRRWRTHTLVCMRPAFGTVSATPYEAAIPQARDRRHPCDACHSEHA